MRSLNTNHDPRAIECDFVSLNSQGAEMLVAGQPVGGLDVAFEKVATYARQRPATLRYYDGTEREPDPLAEAVVTIEDIGRMTLINPRLDGDDAASLLDFDLTLLASIKIDNLTDIKDFSKANPDPSFVAMCELWARITSIPNIDKAKASKLLHLKRPNLFPILDSHIEQVYGKLAAQAGKELGWAPQKDYWSVIAADIEASAAELVDLKQRLRGDADPLVRHAAWLTDLRLQDILAWEPRPWQ